LAVNGEKIMRLTVANFSFEILPLEGTLSVAHALGFKGVDIAGFHARGNCSFEPEAVAADPQKQADTLLPLLEKYGLFVSDYFTQFGAAPRLHSLNDPDPAVRKRNLSLLRGAARFARLIGSPGVTILPGIDHPSQTNAENIAISAEVLRHAVQIAGEQGIELRFEPHMGSIADAPELAVQLVEAAPGAKITFDISHFMLQYIPLERIYTMIPHVGHVHVRQARPGRMQVAFDEGAIDFVEVIHRLEAAGYTGDLTIEYVCENWFGLNRNDTLYETSVTKRALEPYVGLS